MALVLGLACAGFGGISYWYFGNSTIPEAPKLEQAEPLPKPKPVRLKTLSGTLFQNESEFEELKTQLQKPIPWAPEMDPETKKSTIKRKICCQVIPTESQNEDLNQYQLVRQKLRRVIFPEKRPARVFDFISVKKSLRSTTPKVLTIEPSPVLIDIRKKVLEFKFKRDNL